MGILESHGYITWISIIGIKKMDESVDEKSPLTKKKWQSPELTELDLALTESGSGPLEQSGYDGLGEFDQGS